VGNKKPDPPKRVPASDELYGWWAVLSEREDYEAGPKAKPVKRRSVMPAPPPKGKEKENASVGDALRGLTSEGGTGSLLKGMLRYMSGK
jgi:hypothetical protein